MKRALLVAALLCAAGCSGSSAPVGFDSSAPTTGSTPSSSTTLVPATSVESPPSIAPDGSFVIAVDPSKALGDVSPMIRGLSGAPTHYLQEVGATMNSWGGNTASRYNYLSGHFTNAGLDWSYRNGDQGAGGDEVSAFLADSAAGNADTRLAVPTLGWVAKDADSNSCSFPDATGCGTAGGASCQAPGAIADPARTSLPSTPEQVAAWVQSLVASGREPTYLAMDNEPELWGVTHYDVHPGCTTYEEILEKYLTYADAIRPVAPNTKFAGPVMCCWYSFWLTAPGPAGGAGPSDFLTWFLTNVAAHDEEVGHRTIDALDVHYYPQSDVYNERVDDATAALRLRSTRSLYDPTYTDESWVRSNIQLLPRLRGMIDTVYPGTELSISEWNFGADASMNGALTIADVLGIYGREGVDVACYWRYPPEGSPGYFAFKMHGNYDGAGAAFDGTSIAAASPDVDRLSSFAVLDQSTGMLKIMLINKQPDASIDAQIPVAGRSTSSTARVFTYSDADPASIVASTLDVSGTASLTLPASSITVLELPSA